MRASASPWPVCRDATLTRCCPFSEISAFTQALDKDTGNTIGLCSPVLRTPATPFDAIGHIGEDIPDFALGPSAYSPKVRKQAGSPPPAQEVIVDMGSPPSAFHYQVRVPFSP